MLEQRSRSDLFGGCGGPEKGRFDEASQQSLAEATDERLHSFIHVWTLMTTGQRRGYSCSDLVNGVVQLGSTLTVNFYQAVQQFFGVL